MKQGCYLFRWLALSRSQKGGGGIGIRQTLDWESGREVCGSGLSPAIFPEQDLFHCFVPCELERLFQLKNSKTPRLRAQAYYTEKRNPGRNSDVVERVQALAAQRLCGSGLCRFYLCAFSKLPVFSKPCLSHFSCRNSNGYISGL